MSARARMEAQMIRNLSAAVRDERREDDAVDPSGTTSNGSSQY